MKKDWENVTLMPEFDEQGVACYRLDGGDYLNEYYVVSEAETRKLLNTPEIVGYEVYNCLFRRLLRCYINLKEQKKVTTAEYLIDSSRCAELSAGGELLPGAHSCA